MAAPSQYYEKTLATGDFTATATHDLDVHEYTSIEIFVAVSAVSGTSPTLDLKVSVIDEASGNIVDIYNGAMTQFTTTTTHRLTIGPNLTDQATGVDRTVCKALAKRIRITETIGGSNTPTLTRTLAVQLRP